MVGHESILLQLLRSNDLDTFCLYVTQADVISTNVQKELVNRWPAWFHKVKQYAMKPEHCWELEKHLLALVHVISFGSLVRHVTHPCTECHKNCLVETLCEILPDNAFDKVTTPQRKCIRLAMKLLNATCCIDVKGAKALGNIQEAMNKLIGLATSDFFAKDTKTQLRISKVFKRLSHCPEEFSSSWRVNFTQRVLDHYIQPYDIESRKDLGKVALTWLKVLQRSCRFLPEDKLGLFNDATHMSAVASFLSKWPDSAEVTVVVSDLMAKAISTKYRWISSSKTYVEEAKERIGKLTDGVIDEIDQVLQTPIRDVGKKGKEVVDKGLAKLNKAHKVVRKIPGLHKQAEAIKKTQERLKKMSGKLSNLQVVDPETIKRKLREPIEMVKTKIDKVIDKGDKFVTEKVEKTLQGALRVSRPYIFLANKMVGVLSCWPELGRLAKISHSISDFLSSTVNFKYFSDIQSKIGGFLSRITTHLKDTFQDFLPDWKTLSKGLLNNARELSGKIVFPGLLQNLHSNMMNCLSMFKGADMGLKELFSQVVNHFNEFEKLLIDKHYLKELFTRGLKDLMNVDLNSFDIKSLIKKFLKLYANASGMPALAFVNLLIDKVE